MIAVPVARTYIGQNGITFELTCRSNFKLDFEVDNKCQIPDRTDLIEILNVSYCGYMCTPPAIVLGEKLQELITFDMLSNHYNDSMTFSCEVLNSSFAEKQKCFITNLNSSLAYNAKEFRLVNVIVNYGNAPRTAGVEKTKMSVYLEKYDMNSNNSINFNCQTGIRTKQIKLRQLQIISKNQTSLKVIHSQCSFHCNGTLPLNKICNASDLVIEHNAGLSVGLFIMSTLIKVFMTGLTYSMFEAGVVAIMKQYNYDYGIQRIYGSIGGMVFAPLTGFLIDHFGTGSYTDY